LRNNICPYLGLKTDPKTVLEFPSIGNHCHKAMPVAPVNAKHQEKYCLTAQYVDCPVFRRAEIQRIPTRVTDSRVLARRRRFLLTVVLMTVVFSVVAVAVVVLRQNPGLIVAPTTQAAGLQEEPSATPSLLPTDTPAPSATLEATQTQTQTPAEGFRPFLPTTDLTRQACPKPDGWVVYIYKSTDSLALLGNYYGISPMELMTANCLTSPALLCAGDRVYVPGATITPTPTITFTPTVTNTRRPVVIVTQTNTPGSGPPPPPPTWTPVPPTPVPPTDTPIVPTLPGG
jgi:hypothetical protein